MQNNQDSDAERKSLVLADNDQPPVTVSSSDLRREKSRVSDPEEDVAQPKDEVKVGDKKDANGKDDKTPDLKPTSFRKLFYFAEKKDKFMLFIAITCSCAQGALLPAFTIIFGNLTNSFSPTLDHDTVVGNVQWKTIQMVLIGVGVFCASAIALTFWNLTANRQLKRLKLVYFERLLYQNSVWYDKQAIDSLAVNYISHINSFQSIFGSKMHIFFMQSSLVVSGFIIGLVVAWLYTIFIILLTPMILIGMSFFVFFLKRAQKAEKDGYAEAGAVTDQAFTYIKTVKTLNGEDHEVTRYSTAIDKAKNGSINNGFKSAFAFGIFFFAILILYGLSFLIGSRLISDKWINDNSGKLYDVGAILAVFFSVTTAAFGLAQLGPLLKEIEGAKYAMAHILHMINNQQVESCGKERPSLEECTIEFKNVSFAYPSNAEVTVLKNLSLTINTGESIALVGPSGSGKSTIVQLLERYYDPTEGNIYINGIDIKEIDLKYLRSKIGLVSQQPMLFADTIKNNVLMGIENKESVKDEDIWAGMEQANAADFVRSLEKQLNEYVGSMGGQLSGGQKQRIAIARAIVRKPTLFLFDEATSALDRKNEKEIQKTIDSIASQKTSITIAHRLATIKSADKIYVLSHGDLVESGSHDELMNLEKGIYMELIDNQLQEFDNEEDGPEEKLDGEDNRSLTSEIQLSVNDNKGSKIMSTESIKDSDVKSGKKKIKKEVKPSVWNYIGTEKRYLPFGIIFSLCNGSIMPIFGLILARIVGTLSNFSYFVSDDIIPPADITKEGLLDDINIYVILFHVLAVCALIFNFVQMGVLNYVGERFTNRLRKTYFRRLLYEDMEYHDLPANEPGNLSARLETECHIINTLVGTYLGSIAQSLSSFIVGIIIAFTASWKLTLITLGMSPLLILSGLIEGKMMMGTKDKETEEQNNFLQETLNNMKIVRSLNAEKAIYSNYERNSEILRKMKFKAGIIGAFFASISQMSMFVVYAIIFYVGAILQRDDGLSFINLLTAMFSLIFGAYGAGMANQFLGNIGEAQASAIKILKEVETQSKIEADPINPKQNANGYNELKPNLEGNIEFRNVSFHYKGRKNWVLRNLNLKMDANKSYALVGASGCGKSTIMQMLLRFYDPDKGSILIDGYDIREINLQYLRSLFGTVRQEPSLFNGTIAYNIKYNMNNITLDNMRNAALQASAIEFIDSVPEGFERDVGNRGEKLSGGQKQRIAIARIIARKPNIYLFDEATSALDSKSEEVVQQAIENISKDTTSITIAHRISTIKHVYKIFMFEKGVVKEEGSYQELIDLKQHFYKMALF